MKARTAIGRVLSTAGDAVGRLGAAVHTIGRTLLTALVATAATALVGGAALVGVAALALGVTAGLAVAALLALVGLLAALARDVTARVPVSGRSYTYDPATETVTV